MILDMCHVTLFMLRILCLPYSLHLRLIKSFIAPCPKWSSAEETPEAGYLKFMRLLLIFVRLPNTIQTTIQLEFLHNGE